MTFNHPVGLIGLLVVPIILLLHLLRERHHRQVISNINLWSFLEDEVRGSRPRRIPITWILILDLLIGGLLALAWAQPQIKLPFPVKVAHHYIILIDVSASMQTRDWSPSRLDRAVLEATTMINGLSNQDIATIITFGEKPTLLADTRQVEIQEVLSRLVDLKAVEVGHEIDPAFVMGLSTLDGNIPIEFHLFTDAAFPLDRPEITDVWREFPYPIYCHFYTGETNNQAVMDVEVQVIDETHIEVFTRVANFSHLSSNRMLVLLSDEEPIDSTDIMIPPESTITHLWRLNKQATAFTVALSGGDQYLVDDTFTTGVTPFKKVHVVYVTENPSPIDLAIQAIPGTELTIFSPEEYSPHFVADLTIFRNALPSSWPDSTVLIIEPPEDVVIDEPIFPPRLKQPIDITSDVSLQVPMADPLLNGIDFGSIRWVEVWKLAEIPEGFSKIVQIGDTPILLHGRRGNSDIIVLLANLDSGNFTKDPAFIVLLANIVSNTYQIVLPEKIPLNHPIPLPKVGDYQLLRISPPGLESVEYHQSWPLAWEDTFNPGAYLIELQDARGNSTIHAVGINAADETESDLHPKEWIHNLEQNPASNASSQTTINKHQINLVPYLLLTVLLLMMMEALIAWR